MPHRLLMDVHVPKSITDGVRRRGIDVETAQDQGAGTETDEQLLHRATAQDRILFSQDMDFCEIAARWEAANKRFPGIVYSPQLGSSIGRTIEDLELICKCALASDFRSQLSQLEYIFRTIGWGQPIYTRILHAGVGIYAIKPSSSLSQFLIPLHSTRNREREQEEKISARPFGTNGIR